MKTIISAVLLAGLSIFSLSSCSLVQQQGGTQEPQALVPLSCIAVLPSNTSVDAESNVSYATARSLELGARFADSVLRRELGGHEKVRIIGENELAGLVSGIEGGLSGTMSAIGKKVNCEGVLLTTVQRFKQREGSELASDSPASAEFQMVLRHSGNGAVLWSSDFSETQDSFLSNVFSYKKMQSRGFKWVIVEKLMEQGIVERLGECPYL